MYAYCRICYHCLTVQVGNTVINTGGKEGTQIRISICVRQLNLEDKRCRVLHLILIFIVLARIYGAVQSLFQNERIYSRINIGYGSCF